MSSHCNFGSRCRQRGCCCVIGPVEDEGDLTVNYKTTNLTEKDLIYVCVQHFYDISALVGCRSSVSIRPKK